MYNRTTTTNTKSTTLSGMNRNNSWGDVNNTSTNDIIDNDKPYEWSPSPPKHIKSTTSTSNNIKDKFGASVTSQSVKTGSNPFHIKSLATASKTASTTNNNAGSSSHTTSKVLTSNQFASNSSNGKKSSITTSNKSLAPMFRTAPPSKPPSRSVTPIASGSGSQPTKKRALPWDAVNHTSKDTVKSSSTYRILGSEKSSIKDTSTLTSTSATIRQKLELSPEQQKVLQMVLAGGNVFFTGSAGTGKSVLLRNIISALKDKYKGRSDAVVVTASTGMAACNIGGTTIHSFSGIGLGTEPIEQLISKVKKQRLAAGRWQRAKVLVIDEISMVDGVLFDKLEAIACAISKKSKFGGLQIIITGDFFQLPPVCKNGPTNFAFEAKSWKSVIDHTVNLTQVFRQKDTRFVDMLNEMRYGIMSPSSIVEWKKLDRLPEMEDGTEPTELFSTRNEVDTANQNRMKALSGEIVTYKADDWPAAVPGKSANTYLSNFMAPERLALKVGAQVMLVKNMDTLLVNGTIGVVVGFGVAEFEYSDNEVDTTQQSNKKAKVSAGVAQGTEELAPRIEWRIPGGGTETKLMAREEFKVENEKKELLARRRQYPIILAWAMSIHKSQGQTLPRVKVNLRKVFEKGQSYVALSRATSLEGLQVIGFDPSKVTAHPKVITWSQSLSTLH